jgi:hypothetical protein
MSGIRLVVGVTVSLLAAAPAAFVTADRTQGPALTPLRVWFVGSPHEGDVPTPRVPLALKRDLAEHGLTLRGEAFPARNFAARYLDALERNAPPDLLVISNFGTIDGIEIAGEKFDGIGEDPRIRQTLVQITGAFDSLLGPQRGWVFASSGSVNHAAVKRFSTAASACPAPADGIALPPDLARIVPEIVTAYLRADGSALLAHTDPERLASGGFLLEARSVGPIQSCEWVGNDRLAFVLVRASYEADGRTGRTPVVLVFRKPAAAWQLLVAARDPITTGQFMRQAGSFFRGLRHSTDASGRLQAPLLVSPPDGAFPPPASGQRFGAFRWRSGASDDAVVEIGEFAYQNDARLFLVRGAAGSLFGVSAGQLWTTRHVWQWRIWSVGRSGEIAFSESRSFRH